MNNQTIPRFHVLDSWRGIAACMIALFHFRINSHLADLNIWNGVWSFVDFFFVLSGFVIFANYAHRLQNGFGFWRFMALRLGRLYPLHIFIVAVHVGWELLQIIVPTLNEYATFAPFSQPGETLDFIIANIFLVHALGFYDMTTVPLNGASWSISTEFYAYAVFAMALIVSRKKIHIVLPVIAIASFTFLFAKQIYLNSTFEYGFIRCLYGFSAGAILWYVWKASHERICAIQIPKIIWSAAEVVFVITLFGLMLQLSNIYMMAVIPFFAAMIFMFSFERGHVSAILKHKAFIWLGILSYSIYMTHSFIGGKLATAVQLLDRFTPHSLLTTINGDEALGANVWQGDMITVIYMLIIIAASMCTYVLIEKPGRDISRKWIKARDEKPAHHNAK